MTKARDIASAAPAPSTVSATEIGYLDGVTSAIQTQIDGKQAANANVSTTELGYLDGVTSAIQTQLNAKTDKSTLTTTGDIYYASSANTPARLGIGSTGNVLTVSGGIPAWAAPAGGGGKVLQVVEGTKTGQASSSSNTYADIGLSVSITPSSSASKVLVFATCSSVTKYGGNTNVGFKLLRGSTSIFNTDAIATNNATGTNSIGTVSLVKLDSPSTTSATTYKVQMANVDSAGTVAVNDYVSSNTNISTIIAMEIGA